MYVTDNSDFHIIAFLSGRGHFVRTKSLQFGPISQNHPDVGYMENITGLA